MVWFGWEMDVLDGMNRIGMPPIVAHNRDGSAITGIVRSEMITPVATTSIPISLSQQIQNYASAVTIPIRLRAWTIGPPSPTASCRA